MTPFAVLFAVAVIAGFAVALQGQFMGAMDRAAGTATSVFITYGVGGMLAAVVYLVSRPRVAAIRDIPRFAWFAGVLGLVIVGGISYAGPRLGLSRVLVITVTAQLLAAALIDHFGLFGAQPRPIDTSRIAGLAATIVGVWLVVKP